MRNYKVTITETLQMTVEVRADNLAEAEEKVEEKWNKGEYVLGAEHFAGADFKASEKVKTRPRGYER